MSRKELQVEAPLGKVLELHMNCPNTLKLKLKLCLVLFTMQQSKSIKIRTQC